MSLLIVSRYIFIVIARFVCVGHAMEAKLFFFSVFHALIQYVLRELPSSPVPASCCTALLEAFRKSVKLFEQYPFFLSLL